MTHPAATYKVLVHLVNLSDKHIRVQSEARVLSVVVRDRDLRITTIGRGPVEVERPIWILSDATEIPVQDLPRHAAFWGTHQIPTSTPNYTWVAHVFIAPCPTLDKPGSRVLPHPNRQW